MYPHPAQQQKEVPTTTKAEPPQLEAEPEVVAAAAGAKPSEAVAEAAEIVAQAEPARVEASEAPVAPTPEEELVEASLQEEAVTEGEGEEAEAIPLTDDIWKVPQLISSGGSQIRFAEDLAIPGRDGGRRRDRRGKGGGVESAKAKRSAKRKARSTQPEE